MNLYKHKLGGVFAITGDYVMVYSQSEKRWKRSAWEGKANELLPQLTLIGTNLRCKKR